MEEALKALKRAEHDLTFYHGLYASDQENFSEAWQLDNTNTLAQIEDAIEKLCHKDTRLLSVMQETTPSMWQP